MMDQAPTHRSWRIDEVWSRAVTRVGPTRVELELDLSQLGRVEFFSTRVFELDFYVLRGIFLGKLKR